MAHYHAQICGTMTRVQVGKAGMRLADQIKKIVP
jgi:hypothetical protein